VIDEAVGAKFVGLSVKYKLIDTQVCGKKRTRKLWLKKKHKKTFLPPPYDPYSSKGVSMQ
jgi:hypothetical protein